MRTLKNSLIWFGDDMEIVDAKIGSIRVPNGHRNTSPKRVQDLADSILQIGLLQPIGLNNSHVLIYGRHRLEAFQSLDRRTIPAVILDFDDMKSEMATIDENLRRVELTTAQYAKQLKRRKELYEAMHPETKAGKAPGKTDGKGGKTKNDTMTVLPFAADTAAKTGKSRRTVERDIALADKLDDAAVETLADHPVANSKTELKKLADLPADKQRDVADKLASGKAKTVGHAVTGKRPRKKAKKKIKATPFEEESDDTPDEPTEDDSRIAVNAAFILLEKRIREVGDDYFAAAAARLENLAAKLRSEL